MEEETFEKLGEKTSKKESMKNSLQSISNWKPKGSANILEHTILTMVV